MDYVTGESRISNIIDWLDTQSIIDILDDGFWSKADVSTKSTKLTVELVIFLKRTSTLS